MRSSGCYGRLITDLRRWILRATGNCFRFFDPNLRDAATDRARKSASFQDQYEHPDESKQTLREALGWLDSAGFDFVTSIPGPGLFAPFSPESKLFQPGELPSALGLALAERSQALSGYREGGLSITIGRKRS